MVAKPVTSILKIFLVVVATMGIGIQASAQVFEVSSPNPSVPAGSGSANFDLIFSIEQTSGAFIDTCGFSFQYSHDPAVLQFSGTGAEPTGALSALDSGQGPGFFDGQTFTTGFTVGTVYSFSFQETIVFDVPKQVVSVGYSAVPSAIANLTAELITVVNLSNTLGSPVIDNIISNCSGGTETLLGADCLVTLLPAPPLNYEISTPDQSLLATQVASQGIAADFRIVQQQDDPADITPTNGFSFAYGHDSSLLNIDSVTQGPDLAGLKGGSGPEFFQESLFTNGGAVGCLYDFQVTETLTFDSSLHVATFNYSAVPGAFTNLSDPVDTVIQQSTVLGTPAIESVVVINGGTAVQAICQPATFSIQPTPAYTLSAPAQTASFSSATGNGSFDVTFELQEDSGNPGFPNNTQGFSIGLGHPEGQLSVSGGAEAGVVGDLSNGSGPDFFDINTFSNGITFGCVYSFTDPGGNVLVFDVGRAVVTASYDTVPGAFVGQQDPILLSLTENNGLGTPAVEQVVVVNSQSQSMFVAGCTVELSPGGGFDRGNCNDDSGFDIADAVVLLTYLFLSGSVNCELACDANDDNQLNIADSVFVLSALFTGGPQPPGNGSCGPDPTPGSLTCDTFNSCL
ncbi:MAG: hypothetical protein CBC13_05755 [Planctomycetia bacterium TMED53]|nr:MAG: hypothetical protein CBC13_05755 [Planctomycetia bacterium TMED53]